MKITKEKDVIEFKVIFDNIADSIRFQDYLKSNGAKDYFIRYIHSSSGNMEIYASRKRMEIFKAFARKNKEG